MKKYFYADGETKKGPYTKDQLLEENLNRKSKLWCYGMDEWTELSKIPELIEVFNSIPPEINLSQLTTEKSKNYQNKNLSQASDVKVTFRSKKPKTQIIWFGIIILLIGIAFSFLKITENKTEVNYNKVVENSFSSDEDFDSYVEKFYRDLEFYGIYPRRPKKKIIKFSKLEQIENATHLHGLSFGFDNDDLIEIYINPISWEKSNRATKYLLMYHELSHDILNLDDLELTEENIGKLMYPSIETSSSLSMDDFIESSHDLFENFDE